VRRNLVSLFAANALFALAFGIYELAFPLFLDDRGVSLAAIGWVLAAAGVVNLLVIVYGGRLADVLGRRGVYAGSFLACGATIGATPFVPGVGLLAALKACQTAAASLRHAMRGVLLYESVQADRFGRLFGPMAGLEPFTHAVSFACVGMAGAGAGATLSYRGLFAIAAASLAVGAIVFLAWFREPPDRPQETGARLSLRSLFTLDLHPKLYLMIASGFVFGVGLAMSHALWVLYFREQLAGPWAGELAAFDMWLAEAWPWAARVWTSGEGGAVFALVSLLAIIHRVGLGVPMFLTSRIRRSKLFYVAGLGVHGVLTVVVALADWLTGSFLLVALLWPLHDLLGAGVWFPLQERFVQQYSRPEQRGTQVAKVRALSATGLVIGTALAGVLMAVSPALPFFVGGILIVAASVILVWL
jgi:MFS family permease